MPIQGTSADIIKIAMKEIYDFLAKGKYVSNMIMQVHDELVFNMKKEEEEELTPKIQTIMENIIKDKAIQLIVDI